MGPGAGWNRAPTHARTAPTTPRQAASPPPVPSRPASSPTGRHAYPRTCSPSDPPGNSAQNPATQRLPFGLSAVNPSTTVTQCGKFPIETRQDHPVWQKFMHYLKRQMRRPVTLVLLAAVPACRALGCGWKR
ncbi:Exodeoxyribonuclease V beta chain [Actinacidiphila cocklensis]|uniref:Exodeoxyribonuclease V beta chain n=1 Tax=Actinacidiphila cocklensis TaxID=887465 RepID=A0A9W4DQS9_9ACTN|nr:Exodeoxyribonuclease V beta chain [Actinacidiphila cocklensis]